MLAPRAGIMIAEFASSQALESWPSKFQNWLQFSRTRCRGGCASGVNNCSSAFSVSFGVHWAVKTLLNSVTQEALIPRD